MITFYLYDTAVTGHPTAHQGVYIGDHLGSEIMIRGIVSSIVREAIVFYFGRDTRGATFTKSCGTLVREAYNLRMTSRFSIDRDISSVVKLRRNNVKSCPSLAQSPLIGFGVTIIIVSRLEPAKC